MPGCHADELKMATATLERRVMKPKLHIDADLVRHPEVDVTEVCGQGGHWLSFRVSIAQNRLQNDRIVQPSW